MLASGSSSEGELDMNELTTVAAKLCGDSKLRMCSMSNTTQLLFKPESVAGSELPQLLPGGRQAARVLWIHTLVDKKTRTQKQAIQYTQSASLPSFQNHERGAVQTRKQLFMSSSIRAQLAFVLRRGAYAASLKVRTLKHRACME